MSGFESRPAANVTAPQQALRRSADEKEKDMFSTPRQLSRALDRVLHKVTQPARYTGGELNSIPKDWDDPAIRSKVALAFPDIYELGGSNLGLMVL